MPLVPGKRTLIERNGHEFELPERHTAEWFAYDGDPRRCINLRIDGGQGGIYWVEGVDEEEERIVVHVGDFLTQSGPASAVGEGQPLPPVQGYPFPE